MCREAAVMGRCGAVEDLSISGARVQGAFALRPGDRVDLLLNHPIQRRLPLSGRVVWSRPADARGRYRSGLAFVPAAARIRLELNRLLVWMMR